MNWRDEWKPLTLILAVFLGCYYLPVGTERFNNAILEAFYLVKWYAQEHVILCLVPAFFIAGAIGVFVSQASVMKYLGPKANKVLAYGVASVSGTILAVCSCTVLPSVCQYLFSGRRAWAGNGLSLFRSGNQYSRHRPHRPGARAGARHRPCRGCSFISV